MPQSQLSNYLEDVFGDMVVLGILSISSIAV